MGENDKGNKENHFFDKENWQRPTSIGGVVLLAVVTALVLGSLLFSFFQEEVNYQLPVSQLLQQETELQASSEEAVITAAPSPKEAVGPLDVSDVVEATMPCIVAITSETVQTVEYFFYGTVEIPSENAGSGIIIAQNDEELLIGTNYHVVEGADSITVCFSVKNARPEDAIAEAKLKGTDASMDLAVVAVRLSDIPQEVKDEIRIAQMGDSDSLAVGERAIAIGNALGYGQSVTSGIVSAVNREIRTGGETQSYIQTDAAINFGNSGGALLNRSGQVIGINSAKIAESGAERMGYAIPINEAKPVLADLMDKETRDKVEEQQRGSMGIVTQNVSEAAQQIYEIPAGAFVYQVYDGSAAQQAGLVRGDIITEVDGTRITDADALERLLEYYKAGETVEVVYRTKGADGYVSKTVTLTLQEKETISRNERYEDLFDFDLPGGSFDSGWWF